MQDPRPSESDLDQALEQARKAWLDSMHEFVNEWQDTVDLPTYPLLSEQHLENCRVLPNRLVLLDKMPQRSIVAEVGVKKGAVGYPFDSGSHKMLWSRESIYQEANPEVTALARRGAA